MSLREHTPPSESQHRLRIILGGARDRLSQGGALPPRPITPQLVALVRIFYSSLEELGEFTEVTAGNLPESAQKLLWHEDLMTITLETYHSCPVDVEVLDTVMTGTHYARRVFLKCRPRGRILHFGIVRVNLACLSEEVRRDIAAGTTPVGRALVQHDVLREVRLLSLWSVVPGPELRRIFGASRSQPCYGRTALIYCDDAPAVEVLEILPAG